VIGDQGVDRVRIQIQQCDGALPGHPRHQPRPHPDDLQTVGDGQRTGDTTAAVTSPIEWPMTASGWTP
jgi:hypothetical protein